MQISNDGVFDTEPWETYAASKAWALSAGDGQKTAYARFKDNAGNVSNPASTQITLDTQAPIAATLSSPAITSWYDGLLNANVSFSWNAAIDDNGIKKYEVYIDGSLDQTVTGTPPVTTHSKASSSLTSGNHTWYVKAFDAADISTSSSTFNFNLDKVIPAFGSPALEKTTANQSSITLRMKATDDAKVKGYKLYRIQTGGTQEEDWTAWATYGRDPIDITSTTGSTNDTTTYTDLSLEAGATYEYKLQVYDEFNTYPADFQTFTKVTYSTKDTVRPVWQTSPEIPWVLGDTTKDSVTWQSFEAAKDGVKVVGYLIQRSKYGDVDGSGNPNWQAIGNIHINNVSTAPAAFTDEEAGTYIYPDATVEDGTTYFYRIKAYDAGYIPDEPENQNCNLDNPAKVGASGFLKHSPDDQRWHNFTSDWSNAIIYPSATTKDGTSPEASTVPPISSAQSYAFAGHPLDEISLDWTSNPFTDKQIVGVGDGIVGVIDHYDIQRTTVNTGQESDWNGKPVWSTTSMLFEDHNYDYTDDNGTSADPSDDFDRFDSLKDYYYRVRAIDKTNNVSNWAPISHVRTPNANVPSMPQRVNTIAKPSFDGGDSGHEITLTWQGSKGYVGTITANITSYKIFRSDKYNAASFTQTDWFDINKASLVYTKTLPTAKNDDTALASGKNYTHTWTDSGITESITYYYRILAVDDSSPDPLESPLSALSQSQYQTQGFDTTPDVSLSPAPPVEVSSIYGSNPSDHRLIVTWNRVDAYRTTNGTKLAQNIADGATTSIYVLDGTRFSVGNTIKIDSEILKVTAKNGNTLTVERGKERSVAATHTANTAIYVSDFKEYRLFRAAVPAGITPAASSYSQVGIGYFSDDPTKNYYVDDDVNTDNYYWYYAVAVDNAGIFRKNNTLANPPLSQNINDVNNETPNLSDSDEAKRPTPSYLNPFLIIPSLSAGSGSTGANPWVESITVSTATISWYTDMPTDGMVLYKLASDEGEYIDAKGNPKMVSNSPYKHTITIVGLDKNTAYKYIVRSRNTYRRYVDSNEFTFTTQDFSISNIHYTSTTTTATLTWDTANVPSDSFVEYQLAESGEVEAAQSKGNNVCDESHKNNQLYCSQNHYVSVEALKPGKKYSYKLRSVAADGAIAVSALGNFETKPFDTDQFSIVPDATKIAEENITATSARIVWDTVIRTTSWVDFGLTSGNYSMSAGDNMLNTHHVIDLRNLTPGQTYYYHVRGKDTSSIEYVSKEYIFTAVLRPEVTNIKPKSVTSYAATIFWETNVN
ncbi:hypothetical protein COX25_05435, partial [bacterium (Candidatus Howlettbacteria) CG23_combo_of_CG06-09_8_20_14_all_37_9]